MSLCVDLMCLCWIRAKVVKGRAQGSTERAP